MIPVPRFTSTFTASIVAGLAASFVALWGYFHTAPASLLWLASAIGAFIVFAGLMIVAGRNVRRLQWTIARRDDEKRDLESRLEASNDAEKRFWSGLSHDLRTPLNSIIGYTELILEEVPESLSDPLHHDLERIKLASFDLLVRINELLAVSELKTGMSEPHIQATDIYGLLNDIAVVLTPLAARQNSELRIDVPKHRCIVKTDGVRLEKVLLALATNAVKATFDGRIKLQAGYDDTNEILHLTVSDTGCGMPEEELAAVFEPDLSPHDTAYNIRGGLYVCKQLTEELGGTIDVDSRPDQGTRITVSIPAQCESPSPSIRAAAVAGPANPPNVLIIDENEDAADLLSRHLRRFGCHATISVDGAFGKDLAVDLHPDLIILEVDMSSIDGWAVLKHLQFDSRTREIPVVICSALDMRKRAHELGAVDYLIKPVTAASAVSALKQVDTIGSRLADSADDVYRSIERT